MKTDAEQPPADTQPRTRYFTKITLDNVRTFAPGSELNLCFPDGKLAQWTVLLGENGTGKSTLLQYIATLDVEGSNLIDVNGEKLPRFRPMATEPRWFDWHAENMPCPWSRESQVLKISALLSSPRRELAHVTAEKPKKTISLQSDPVEYGYQLSFGASSDNKPFVKASYTIPRNDDFNEELFLIGYGASRQVGPQLAFNEDQLPLGTLFNDQQLLSNPEFWLRNLDHSANAKANKENLKPQLLLDRAIECLRRVLPQIDKISIKPFNIIEDPSAQMALMFKTPYGEVPFRSLSLGYRTMAGWVMDLFRRMAKRYTELDNPATGAAVVLVDEFDLHLHPQWQMHAMEQLGKQFPNTQFIVTAHSPLIIQAADGKANLAVLRKIREGDRDIVYIENDPVYAKGWRIDQIVTSDLFNLPSARSETFTAMIKRRIQLLQKDDLVDKEKKELEYINQTLRQEPSKPFKLAYSEKLG